MKKQLLLLLGFALGVSQSQAQTVFINEPFNGTSIPSGWAQETNATDGGWRVNSATNLSSQFFTIPANDGNMAATNDDDCNCDKSEERFITPSINLTGATGVLLQFDCFFLGETFQGATEQMFLEVSTDNGNTWTVIQTIAGNANWRTISVNLASYVGQEIRLAFQYNDNGGWLYGAAIDNVLVKEIAQYDMAGLSGVLPEFVEINTPVSLSGVLQNLGVATINSFDLNYSVNGGAPVTQNLTGLNIATAANHNFTHGTPWTPSNAGPHQIKIWASNLNGNADMNNSNDTITLNTTVANSVFQRATMFEQFTSNTCPPCASSDPQVSTFLTNNNANGFNTKLNVVKYHMNFPAPGTDAAHTPEASTRAQYYSLPGVPHVAMGNAFQGHPLNLQQSAVNNETNRPTVFSIALNPTVNGNEVSMEASVTSTIDFNNSNLRLHLVLIENVINASDFNPAPTTNQQVFNYVMRKMLPNANGTTLASLTAGQTQTINLNHTLNNLIAGNMNNVSVVAFLQNHATREIYQSTAMNINAANISEMENINAQIQMFPNPTSELVTIASDSD
ncbi:MAG: Omp28-related outer membrane protein, partial [Crocinitomicaceae bacterium]|nr:Omp28-related outer membrane protein [Crocinitomicaceae bacterium]